MPPRGPYKKSYKRRLTKKYGTPKRVVPAVRTLQAVVRRAIAKNNNKMLETKRSCQTSTDGVEIAHNSYVDLNPYVLQTTQGTADPTTANTNNRIGDQINLKGVSIRMMLELNERYSDVTFRILVVKCAKADNILRASIFNGLSGNKMIDTLNTERYTFLVDKWVHMKAPNTGNIYASGAGGIPQPSGYADQLNTGAGTQTFSRATKIVKLWIPGTKFSKSGIIKYEDNSSQPKFFDYHLLVYAYSNYTTLQDAWNVGRVNDSVVQLYYKDA